MNDLNYCLNHDKWYHIPSLVLQKQLKEKGMRTKKFSSSKHIDLSLWHKHLSINSLFNIISKNEMLTLTPLDLWREHQWSLTVNSLNNSPCQKIIIRSLNHHNLKLYICVFVCFQTISKCSSSWFSNIVPNVMWFNNNQLIIFNNKLIPTSKWVRDELTFNAEDNDVAPELPILL